MKKYIKPQVYEDSVLIDDILIMSVKDNAYNLDELGGFDEIWD